MYRQRFQCSSASRKFLTVGCGGCRPRHNVFQCSSASRKFLTTASLGFGRSPADVSVLFSEPKIPHRGLMPSRTQSWRVSVLFSEPKIPHNTAFFDKSGEEPVSVLFSEPKIPHSAGSTSGATRCTSFQCSSASRKFLTALAAATVIIFTCFSALQRAENSSPV